MTEAAQELVIEIEPPPQNGSVLPVVVGDDDSKQPDPAVEDLRQQLKTITEREAAEKTGREKAETQARERQSEIDRLRESETKARGETVDSQLDAVSNAITAAETESTAAKRDLTAAGEAGEWGKVADAQERIASAQARLVALGQSKSDLEAVKKAPVVREEPKRADPTETFIQSRTPATQTWLRSHMDVMSNPDMFAIAQGADAEARRKGIALDTPEYFALVETRLGYRQEETIVVDPEPTIEVKPKPARRPVTSAPVTREPNGQTGGGNVVKLTAGEAQAATDGTHVWTRYDDPARRGTARIGEPIGVKELAFRKRQMQQNGDYTRHDGDEA